mmetsp:Transcript_54112/g.157186  ORF Transcript_54112/g.157186 Transcript_54112/m.157186 type:complete len:217 (+) Transcript_54112:849-1499(+)
MPFQPLLAAEMVAVLACDDGRIQFDIQKAELDALLIVPELLAEFACVVLRDCGRFAEVGVRLEAGRVLVDDVAQNPLAAHPVLWVACVCPLLEQHPEGQPHAPLHERFLPQVDGSDLRALGELFPVELKSRSSGLELVPQLHVVDVLEHFLRARELKLDAPRLVRCPGLLGERILALLGLFPFGVVAAHCLVLLVGLGDRDVGAGMRELLARPLPA